MRQRRVEQRLQTLVRLTDDQRGRAARNRAEEEGWGIATRPRVVPPARGRERIVWQVEEVVFGGDVQGNDVDNGNNSRKKLENSRNNRFPNSSQRLKPDIKSSGFTLRYHGRVEPSFS